MGLHIGIIDTHPAAGGPSDDVCTSRHLDGAASVWTTEDLEHARKDAGQWSDALARVPLANLPIGSREELVHVLVLTARKLTAATDATHSDKQPLNQAQ